MEEIKEADDEDEKSPTANITSKFSIKTPRKPDEVKMLR